MQPLVTALSIADEGLRAEMRLALSKYPVRLVLEQASLESFQLRRLELDLVFVDFTPEHETLEGLIQRIRALAPTCTVAVVSREGAAEHILQAMRAGAQEFIQAPVEDRLHACLERLIAASNARLTSGPEPAKTIGFISARGGCGATSLACHVAAQIQRATTDYVLLADLDFECGNAAFLTKAETSFTMADALRNVHRLDASLWRGYVGTPVRRLDVIPAPGYTMSAEYARPDSMRQAFRVMRSLYGWVVVDLGRALNPLTNEVATELDELCIVVRPVIGALYQAKQVIQKTRELGIPKARVRLVLNQVEEGDTLKRRDVEEMLREPVYASIPSRRGLDTAYLDGKLAVPESPLGVHFCELANKLGGITAAPEAQPGMWQQFFGRRRVAGSAA
jgi:pilus assembly protein CpaE